MEHLFAHLRHFKIVSDGKMWFLEQGGIEVSQFDQLRGILYIMTTPTFSCLSSG